MIRGRPQVGPKVQVRFEESTLEQVDEFAAESGVSRAEAVRRLVTISLERLRGRRKS